MGLTDALAGRKAADAGLRIQKKSAADRVVALAGNPNVGKSTVFNGLTGLNQHTGNWPGKTVAGAQGVCATKNRRYVLVDLPGAYSLMAHSVEEEVARDFLCFGAPDAVAVVCDATCLERNLNLVLQTLELSSRVVVCVNLMDEARRKNISVDLALLSTRLGVPVVGTTARKKRSLDRLLETLDTLASGTVQTNPYVVRYPAPVEEAIALLEPVVTERCGGRLNGRWLSLKLLDQDAALLRGIDGCLGADFLRDAAVQAALGRARALLAGCGVATGDQLKDLIVSALVRGAEAVCRGVVGPCGRRYAESDRRLDRLLTSRRTGYPVMIALLAVVFWITITAANAPSQLLSQGLFWVQDRLSAWFLALRAPAWLHGVLVLGAYRVLAWVVAVMLPPMAIFFPLFTLLEDAGYLPRVAYNLDRPFQRCRACGKQALCMHYNPFSYIHSEKDILKLVTTLIANTKGDGKTGDDFWQKAETLLYTALIGYIHYEAPVEEQNFSTLIEFINASEVREDDEEFENPVDLMYLCLIGSDDATMKHRLSSNGLLRTALRYGARRKDSSSLIPMWTS